MTLNITALTDVAFLIIIFFMFSTHFHRTSLRPMDLPKEHGQDATEEALNQVIVEIDRAGELSLAGVGPVDVARIIAEARPEAAGASPLSSGAQARPAPRGPAEIVIRADRNAPALHLNTLAMELSRAGIRQWKLATSPGG